MEVIFLSLIEIHSLNTQGIYTDLLRLFVKNGHFVRIISVEPNCVTHEDSKEGYAILHVKTPQMQKVGFVKKGLASLQIGSNIQRALDKHCKRERYDLILMATPPVTLADVAAYIKRRDSARVYLLLKDIWPQAIADLGVISQNGPVYRFYRAKEKKLYALADCIGCMSQANVDYLINHNPEIDPTHVEICPNSIEPVEIQATLERRTAMREKYHIPKNKTVFIYGGNLGRPQGIPFIIECLRSNQERRDCFFVICGAGTEYPKLKSYIDAKKPLNVLLFNGLPKKEYENLIAVCDVGMIFLDYRFTIPNFPSRLLSYMQAGLPVLSCTDPNTDIGDIIEVGGFGWKCLSNDISAFCRTVDIACQSDLKKMGSAGRRYLFEHYTVERSYKIITKE